MRGRVVQILGLPDTEGKLRSIGNIHKSSLSAEVKLKAEIRYLTV